MTTKNEIMVFAFWSLADYSIEPCLCEMFQSITIGVLEEDPIITESISKPTSLEHCISSTLQLLATREDAE